MKTKKRVFMLILILSILLALSPWAGCKEKAHFNHQNIIEEKVLYYQFDTKKYTYPTNVHLSDLERKKLIFYLYFELKMAKNSDYFVDLVDSIDVAIRSVNQQEELFSSKELNWDEFEQDVKKNHLQQPIPFIFSSLSKNANKKVVGFGGKQILNDVTTIRTVIKPTYKEKIMDIHDVYFSEVTSIDIDQLEKVSKEIKNFKIKKMPYITIENIENETCKIEFAYTFICDKQLMTDALCDRSTSDKIMKIAAKKTPTQINPALSELYTAVVHFRGEEANEFLRLFAETTYLPDEKTTIANWIDLEINNYYECEKVVQPLIMNI